MDYRIGLELRRGELPERDRAIGGAGQEAISGWVKGHLPDRHGKTLDQARVPARLGIPQPDGLILPGRGEQPAIRAEGQVPGGDGLSRRFRSLRGRGLMVARPGQHRMHFGLRYINEPHLAEHDDPQDSAVRAPGEALHHQRSRRGGRCADLRNPQIKSLEQPAGIEVPDLDPGVLARFEGGEAGRVRTDRREGTADIGRRGGFAHGEHDHPFLVEMPDLELAPGGRPHQELLAVRSEGTTLVSAPPRLPLQGQDLLPPGEVDHPELGAVFQQVLSIRAHLALGRNSATTLPVSRSRISARM